MEVNINQPYRVAEIIRARGSRRPHVVPDRPSTEPVAQVAGAVLCEEFGKGGWTRVRRSLFGPVGVFYLKPSICRSSGSLHHALCLSSLLPRASGPLTGGLFIRSRRVGLESAVDFRRELIRSRHRLRVAGRLPFIFSMGACFLSLFDHLESGRLSPTRGTLLWWSECPFFLTAILNSIVITLVVSQGCERVGE